METLHLLKISEGCRKGSGVTLSFIPMYDGHLHLIQYTLILHNTYIQTCMHTCASAQAQTRTHFYATVAWSVTNPVGAWLSPQQPACLAQSLVPRQCSLCTSKKARAYKGFLGDGLPGYTRLLSCPPQCPGPRLSMSGLTFIFIQNPKLVCLCVCVYVYGGGTDKWKMQ